MATLGEISEQNDLVQAFFNFLKSAEGKELIEKVGLIAAD
jgi:phosphate transport system substrate-binding protein